MDGIKQMLTKQLWKKAWDIKFNEARCIFKKEFATSLGRFDGNKIW